MSNDLFLRIEGITGESQDASHKGWSSVGSFSWGATQPENKATHQHQ
ncbi:type VI secretion system tube protein Hcp [Erwinia mallotivora]|nr:type VI secretion system tube protein Hcp [Erwinia mallotivora]